MIKFLTLLVLNFLFIANIHAIEEKSEKIANTSKEKIEGTAKGTEPKYSKVALVHGMVCAFCSNSLEKKFKKNAAVEKINVDLESKKVSIKFKKGKSIDNKKLKQMITTSGFKVVSIKNYTSADDSKLDNQKLEKSKAKKKKAA